LNELNSPGTPVVAPERTVSAGRAVITLATTKSVYLRMAINLARSFNVWNRDSGIAFHIITDLDDPMPADLANVKLLRLPVGALGVAFSAKLHLDRLAPAAQTLFIDSDCFVMGPLTPVFDRFAGRAVAIQGEQISDGLWCGDVVDMCRRGGVASLPKFNGGIYYVEPGAQATAVYDDARELETHYDEWKLVRLRGHANEEPIMSVAMARAGLEALPEDDLIMAPFNYYQQIHELDVFRGRCTLSNPPPPSPNYRATVPVRVVHPLIPHFVNDYTDHWRYRAEVLKMRQVAEGTPLWLSRIVAFVTIVVPGVAKNVAKEKLRPLYRKLFGVRQIRLTERV
jgi:hypothetical protein